MKKVLSLVAALCCVMFLFTNCEDDLIKEESNGQDSGIRNSYLSSKEIDAMPEVSSILNKIDEERLKSKTEKSVYNSDYDFYVNKDNVLKISQGSYHSLTFPVYRLPDNGLTENLVLSLEKDGTYSASLYTYDLNPEEKEKLRTNTPFLFENAVKRLQLPLFKPSTLTGKITQIWYTEIVVIPCSSGEHNSKNFGQWHQCIVTPPRILVITRSLLIDDGDNGWVTGGDYSAPGNGSGFGGTGTYNPNVPPYEPNKSEAILTFPQLNVQTNEQKFYNQLDNEQKVNINIKEVRIPLLAQLEANNYSEASQEVAEFVLSNIAVTNLSTDLRVKLMQLAATKLGTVTSIKNYLEENEFSEESIEFVTNFIASTEENLNLDFNKSILSPFNIDLSSVSGNSPEENKFNSIYNKLLSSPTFKSLFLNVFNDNKNFNVKFEIEDLPPNPLYPNQIVHGLCQLQPYMSPSVLTNKIKINRYSLLNFPDDYMAVVILHECIHAFLNVKLKNPSIGMSINDINNMDLQECINHFFENFSGQQSQHDFMIYNMIPNITQILNEIKPMLYTPHQINLTQNPSLPGGVAIHTPMMESIPLAASAEEIPWNWNDYFKYLSYTGLRNCNSFSSIFPPNSVPLYYLNTYQVAGLTMFENQ